MAAQQTALPTQKVLAGGLVGIAGFVLVAAAHRWMGWDIPPDVASVAVASVASLVSYLVPAHERDAIEAVDAKLRQAADAMAQTAAGSPKA